ncbi:MAG: hypothetical protein KIS80_00430 [Anaerolineales bacterium]|nr:hypothetical protein [Anaerolineales bacterium]
MQKKSILMLVLAVLVVAQIACGFNYSTANIADAYMSLDSEGTQGTSVYSDEAVFYAIVDLANAPDGTEVTAAWIAADVEGEEPNLLIDEVSITSGSTVLVFDLANEVGFLWPAGAYQVEIYLNGELDTTLNFQVQ